MKRAFTAPCGIVSSAGHEKGWHKGRLSRLSARHARTMRPDNSVGCCTAAILATVKQAREMSDNDLNSLELDVKWVRKISG